MRIGTLAFVCLLWGCPSDVADQVEFACEVHADCYNGWFCAVDRICRVGAIPVDVGVDTGLPPDRGPADAAILDATPPPDAAPDSDAGLPDRDGDGVEDRLDNCPDTPNPDQTDSNANGRGDACDDMPPPDSDGDGVPDGDDNCPETPNRNQVDTDGNGVGDACEPPPPLDSDEDGVPDDRDNCPNTPNPDQDDRDENGVGDACEMPPDNDVDGDGVVDLDDNCPDVPNRSQLDRNNNGYGDACEIPCEIDSDCRLPIVECDIAQCGRAYFEKYASGICQAGGFCSAFADELIFVNRIDCPADATCSVVDNAGICAPDPVGCPPDDSDGDGWADGNDNCPEVANADQADLDLDGLGDVCDTDIDGDDVPNDADNCPDLADASPLDLNQNGISDACEIACENDGDPCRLVQPFCEPDRQCGSAFALIGYSGFCDGRYCANFGQPRPFDQGACNDDQICQLDAERPCAPSDLCLPVEDCNVNTVGEPCRFTREVCADAPGTCGSGVNRVEWQGRCTADLACGGAVPGDPEPVGACAADAQCFPGDRDRDAFCNLVEVCIPGAPCTPDFEGAVCHIENQFGRRARCVDGNCKAWDCMTRDCNELGPRRFSLENELSPEGERFREDATNLVWAIPPLNQPMTLGEAHQLCTNVDANGPPWRLPTMYELHSIAARSIERLNTLAASGIDPGMFVSRTIVSRANVMGVNLLTGVSQPIARDGIDGYSVICVFERDQMGQDTWDLSTRRQTFLDWPAATFDTLTDLLWFLPIGAPQADREAAEVLCADEDGDLPTVETIMSLLTFNSDVNLPAPGFWLAYTDDGFAPVDDAIWASDPAPPGSGWVVDLETGATEILRADTNLKVVCIDPSFVPIGRPDMEGMPVMPALPEQPELPVVPGMRR